MRLRTCQSPVLNRLLVTTGAVSKEINKKIIPLYDYYSEEENGVFMD